MSGVRVFPRSSCYRFGLAAVIAASLSVVAGQVQAGEVFGGVYDHALASRLEGGADIMLGYRTDPIQSLWWLAKPSVHILLSGNTRVSTDFVAVGVDWRVPLAFQGKLYLRPGFGIAYTNGEAGIGNSADLNVPSAVHEHRLHLAQTRIDFGSQDQFEPEMALGYSVTPRWAVEASYVHLSNGQILHHGKNQGLDDAGLRVAYRF